MAVVADTYLTFDAKGAREQLADAIYRVDPSQTPLVSSLPKERTRGTLFDWQTDVLDTVDTSNAHLVGDEATNDPVTPTVRVGNFTQILRKVVSIADSQEARESAGRSSEGNYQAVKFGLAMRRDLEGILFANQGGDAGASNVAPTMATLGAWLKSNTSFGAGGADPTWTAGVPNAGRTDGTPAAFAESMLQSVAQSMFENSSEWAPTLYVGAFNKKAVSTFSGIATLTYNLNSPKPGTIVGSASVYVSEFGDIRVVPTRFQRARDAYLINRNFASIRNYRPFKRVPLAKTGDNTRFMLIHEVTLQVKNEAAHAGIFDLTTS